MRKIVYNFNILLSSSYLFTLLLHGGIRTAMMLEKENTRLRAEHADIRTLVAQLQEQLAAALAWIVELEQQRPAPPLPSSSRTTPPTPRPHHRARSVRPAITRLGSARRRPGRSRMRSITAPTATTPCGANV